MNLETLMSVENMKEDIKEEEEEEEETLLAVNSITNTGTVLFKYMDFKKTFD